MKKILIFLLFFKSVEIDFENLVCIRVIKTIEIIVGRTKYPKIHILVKNSPLKAFISGTYKRNINVEIYIDNINAVKIITSDCTFSLLKVYLF